MQAFLYDTRPYHYSRFIAREKRQGTESQFSHVKAQMAAERESYWSLDNLKFREHLERNQVQIMGLTITRIRRLG